MSIRSYFMAKFYDATMKQCEQVCLGAWRSELLSEAEGDVLEIGSGTGVNLRHYSDRIDNLVMSEPDRNMRRQLEQKVKEAGRKNVDMAPFGAESIDFPDESFDCVVSTLVLCSVEDQKTSLDEIYRLLRPGGTLRLIEHVVADSDPKTLRWQKILNPVWNFMCCNCHLTRDTASAIEQAGFRTDRLERAMIEEAPSVVKYNLRGIAEKR